MSYLEQDLYSDIMKRNQVELEKMRSRSLRR